MRHRIIVVAGLVALALAASIAPAAAAPTPGGDPGVRKASGRALDLKSIRSKPAAPARHGKPAVTTSSADCAQVRKNPRAFAKGAKYVSCTSTEPVDKSKAGGLSTQAVSSCSNDENGIIWYWRSGACQWDYFYETIIDGDGAIVGTATFRITQEMTLQSNSGLFFENVTLEFLVGWGLSAGNRQVSLGGACQGGGCQTLNGLAYGSSIGIGQSKTGQIVYEGAATGKRTWTDTRYLFVLYTPPGVLGPTSSEWWGPPSIRCDKELNGVNGGCVIPADVPTYYPSVSQFGAAAINIAVAQNLPDHWGWYTPLTRLINDSLSNSNRAAVCAGFVADPYVTRDSCDEFAFASTYQSGPLLNPRTTDCAEIIPWTDGSAWYYEVVKMNGYERCLRGHVDSNMNSLLGAFLGSSFLTPNRVLDGDGYYVTPVM
jgi:hypothetical protein